MKRLVSVSFVLIFGALALCAEDLKVAVLAPLSGAVPSFGQSMREGVLLAINEVNAKGGVLGRTIVPIIEDSQCSADSAVNAANKVINQDGVHYIIGEVCSSATIPVSEIANPAKVVVMTPDSTNANVTVNAAGKTKDYIFRACFIDPFQGKVLALFAKSRLKSKTAFILYDQSNDYTIGLSTTFEAQFTKDGGKIVGKESYTKIDADFSAILAKVKIAKPDVVFLPDYYNIVNLVCKQAKEKGITTNFIGGDGWDSPDLDLAADDGGYFSTHYSPSDTRPVVQNFIKNFGSAYKDDTGKPKVPDGVAVLAYDATNLLLAGIKAAGKDDTTAVKTALEKISFESVTGRISFDPYHNPIKSAVILKIKDGKVSFDSTIAP
jgi:branched-chain amino acid transport system substrate-binding protein